MKLFSRQDGFANLLIVLLLVAAVGAAALYAWQARNINSATSSNQVQSTPTTPAPATPSYFVIPELGIKLILKPGISDLTYYFDSELNAQTDGTKFVSLSSKSIGVLSKGSCAVGRGVSSYGSLGVTKDPNQPFGVLRENGTTIFKRGDSYIYYRLPQAQCSSHDDVNQLMTQQRGELLESLASVQLVR